MARPRRSYGYRPKSRIGIRKASNRRGGVNMIGIKPTEPLYGGRC